MARLRCCLKCKASSEVLCCLVCLHCSQLFISECWMALFCLLATFLHRYRGIYRKQKKVLPQEQLSKSLDYFYPPMRDPVEMNCLNFSFRRGKKSIWGHVLHADSNKKFPTSKVGNKRVGSEQCCLIKSVGGIQEHLVTHPPLLSVLFALGL